VCPLGRLPWWNKDEAEEGIPDAQDRKISAVWQEVFQASSQTSRFLSFRPLLASRDCDQLQSLRRNKIWDDTIDGMEKGKKSRRIGKKLKKLILLDS
jgi:hypothetical protein